MSLTAISSKIGGLLASHLDFLKKAFSDGGSPSSSRLLAIPHTAAAIFVLVYISIHTGHFPGMDEATGLGAFATAPYAVNRISGIFKKDGTADPAVVPPVSLQV